MKKITTLLIFAVLLFASAAHAQSFFLVNGTILDTATQLPIANKTVTIVDSSTSGNFQILTTVTGPQGQFFDSIWVSGVGVLGVYVQDCNGTFRSKNYAYTPNSGSGGIISWTMSMQICNNATANCNFSVQAVPDTVPMGYYFTSTYNATPASSLTWDFGDGTTGTGASTGHAYAQPGTYVYCLQADSCPPVCDTLVVTAASTFACQSSFIIDTTSSSNGNVIAWNASSVSGGTASSTTFMWDFGDGSTSTQAFPVHNYANPGMYEVCLTMTAVEAGTNNTCTSTFCDSLGVDQNGNLIYKGATMGWTLTVLDFNTFGMNEDDLSALKFYPNPAQDILKIELPDASAKAATVQLFNINGSLVKSLNVNAGINAIDVSALPNGVYLLQATVGEKSNMQKVIIQH